MSTMLRQDKCTQDDYVRLFADSAKPLRWLSKTLTGDPELSERVLATGLEQSLKGADRVFRDWMVSWARRLIIKACVEIVQPGALAGSHESYLLLPIAPNPVNRGDLEGLLRLPSELLQERLLQL